MDTINLPAISLVKNFKNVGIKDVSSVGGKNASLGEMIQHLTPKGIKIPDGFAITASAYWEFIDSNNLRKKLTALIVSLDRNNFSNLREIGVQARALVLNAKFPEDLKEVIREEYENLCHHSTKNISVAVRSSATAEDLPTASFAGQHNSYLNISGTENLLVAVQQCFASLFNDRAIKYREDRGFDHMSIALSVGVQQMVRADVGSAGVAFTNEPESGFQNIILITGSWGLGENVVQGAVNPDEFYVFKPSIRNNKYPIIQKKLGSKSKTMIYANEKSATESFIENIDTPEEKKWQWILNDDEVKQIADWCLMIEEHYGQVMDIEWAKDGITNELFILQARPETIHVGKQKVFKEYSLKEKGKKIVEGAGIGSRITTGVARILLSPTESDKLQPGDILVTTITNPDWDPIMKRASAIVTDKGGRTSHAAIVARELGAVAVVGSMDGTKKIKDGEIITVSTIGGKDGIVYEGKLNWEEQIIDISNITIPDTQVMMILGDPEKAFHLSFYPNNGIGLMRLEFIINSAIQIHPMALVKFNLLKDENAKKKIEELTLHYPDKEKYFVDKLASAVATIAAAFHPKDVIVRMSDFKTNEYANLIGGKEFEPHEENPMLGFRGASRYYSDYYREGFRLECEAMKKVRNEMGLTNVKLMIPFCRTVEEGKKVITQMEQFGLKRGENGLEIYVMAEIPSNVICADEFAKIFDGFSIGSNDLTQLTLGIDRDSALISNLFDEKNEAAKTMIAMMVNRAKNAKSKIGLCGQAPSDFPEFAQFLVEQGIDSISFNPDALIKGIENIHIAEEKIKQHHITGFQNH